MNNGGWAFTIFVLMSDYDHGMALAFGRHTTTAWVEPDGRCPYHAFPREENPYEEKAYGRH